MFEALKPRWACGVELSEFPSFGVLCVCLCVYVFISPVFLPLLFLVWPGYHHTSDEDGGRSQGHRHGQQLQPVHQGGPASLELNIAFELDLS